jgi:DNA-binding transcriptional LysR family regulator
MGTELRKKQLRAVLEDYEAIPATSPVYAVHAHQRHVPPKIRVFIEFLIETFPKAQCS